MALGRAKFTKAYQVFLLPILQFRFDQGQQRENYPFNLLKLSALSYFGGVAFGVIMLAFQAFAQTAQPMIYDENKFSYSSIKDFSSKTRQFVTNSLHRQGVFVIRFSLAIGIFNALMIYLPLPAHKFGEFYGYGNLDSIFYGLVPAVLLFKMKNVPLHRRIAYTTVSSLSYTSFRVLYLDENRRVLKKTWCS